MPELYKNIHGFFDFENFYDSMVERYKDGGYFVEVGCWLGKSSTYLLEKIKQTNAGIIVDFIDTWEGDMSVPFQQDFISRLTPEGFYNQFLENIKSIDSDLKNVKVIKKDSMVASNLYDNHSIDMLFLDDDHSYDYLSKKIEAWLPKVKHDGILAGHDYEQPEVSRAVNELLPNAIAWRDCGHDHVWCYQKNLPNGLRELS